MIAVVAMLAWHYFTAHEGTDWAAWITAVAAALTALILLVTAILALRGLEDARRTRHGLLMVELSRRWAEPQMVEALKLYSDHDDAGIRAVIEKVYEGQNVTTSDLDTFWTLTAAPDLIETIGVLEDEGVVTVEVIRKMWGPPIVSYWSGWREAIEALREYDEPEAEAAYTYFERLANKLAELDSRS